MRWARPRRGFPNGVGREGPRRVFGGGFLFYAKLGNVPTTRKIKIGDIDLLYELKRYRRSRRIKLLLYSDGHFRVTAPYGLPIIFIERFLRSREEWINKKLKDTKINKPKVDTKKEFQALKKEAKRFAIERLEELNKIYGFKFNKITIRNQRSRWGSCTKSGNLSLNYKIIKLPKHLADYIMVHELCHLKEMNHSQKFWDLVAKTFPNHKELRKELVLSGRSMD